MFTHIVKQLISRGVCVKAKKDGRCFISDKPVKAGDTIVWLPKTGYVALQTEVEVVRENMRKEDEDLRILGY
jgi:acyl-CoA hydrolase